MESQCELILWVGDGYCDNATNTPECNYDGGDCDETTTEDQMSSTTTLSTTTVPNTGGIVRNNFRTALTLSNLFLIPNRM